MQSQPLLLKVPVVIFAVLVGSIFVYARAGGSLPFLSRSAQVSPAAIQDVNEPGGGPAIMMGSKSAPAFLPEEPKVPAQAQTVSQPTAPEVSRRTLLPGSKSAVIVTPDDPRPVVVVPVAPTNTPVQLHPATNSLPKVAPNSVPEPRSTPRLLPGSKSIILADPPPLPQPRSAAVQRPVQQSASNKGPANRNIQSQPPTNQGNR